MSKFNMLVDRISIYLKKRGLEKVQGEPHDLMSLYEGALRSIWKIQDKDKREVCSIDIANFLNPYFGGRNVAEALEVLTKKLDINEIEEREKDEIEEIQDKMSDPDYVPTFDELMKTGGEEKN